MTQESDAGICRIGEGHAAGEPAAPHHRQTLVSVVVRMDAALSVAQAVASQPPSHVVRSLTEELHPLTPAEIGPLPPRDRSGASAPTVSRRPGQWAETAAGKNRARGQARKDARSFAGGRILAMLPNIPSNRPRHNGRLLPTGDDMNFSIHHSPQKSLQLLPIIRHHPTAPDHHLEGPTDSGHPRTGQYRQPLAPTRTPLATYSHLL